MRNWSNQDLGMILDVSTEMDQFLETLPGHLQVVANPSSGSELPSCFELQAHVLRARYVCPQYEIYV
jgi:hypothetical protein